MQSRNSENKRDREAETERTLSSTTASRPPTAWPLKLSWSFFSQHCRLFLSLSSLSSPFHHSLRLTRSQMWCHLSLCLILYFSVRKNRLTICHYLLDFVGENRTHTHTQMGDPRCDLRSKIYDYFFLAVQTSGCCVTNHQPQSIVYGAFFNNSNYLICKVDLNLEYIGNERDY